MKRIGHSIQDFKNLIEDNYIYVDKTNTIYDIVTSKKFVFLSRPRRFGKSLTCSVLKYLYSGEKELFKDTFIYNVWDWNKKHPIIHIDFTDIGYKGMGLENALKKRGEEIANEYHVFIDTNGIDKIFTNLINSLYNKYQAKPVIIIDEYDKPIIDFLEDDKRHIAKENKEIMLNFYQPLKANSHWVEFFFMTGVSKFTRAGIFSQLNNLIDITVHQDYNNIVGYTENELIDNFDYYLQKCFIDIQIKGFQKFTDFKDFMLEVRRWYNGYNWSGVDTLYNPTTVSIFMDERFFNNNWFSTGSPSFLFTLIKQNKELGLEDFVEPIDFIKSFEVENISLRAILFQTGYLTIDKIINSDEVKLRFPNYEVKSSYSRFILNRIGSNDPNISFSDIYIQLKKSFENNDLKRVFEIVNAIVSNATSLIYLTPSELMYNTLYHLIFTIYGYEIESQVNTDRGRIDAVIKTKTHIYIFEFKVNLSANKALTQMEEKNYAQKYSLDRRIIVLVGVAVDKKLYKVKNFKEKIWDRS